MSKGLFIFTLVLVTVAVVGMMPVQGNAQNAFFQPTALNSLSWGVPLANRGNKPVYEQNITRQPWSFGVFGGAMIGTELADSYTSEWNTRWITGLPDNELNVTQIGGITGGLNVGYAFNDHLGLEARLHGSTVGLELWELREEWVTEWTAGQYVNIAMPGNPPDWRWVDARYDTHLYTYEDYESSYRTLTIFDMAVHYYPWGGLTTGTRKWRTYIKGGLGLGYQSFEYWDSSAVITMPLGIGARYWRSERIAWQVDFVDNIIFGTTVKPGIKLKTTHNFALSIGLIYSWR